MALFDNIDHVCCMGDDATCYCSHKEMVLRRYVGESSLRAMTIDERNELIAEANWAGEGFYSREELNTMNDTQLANAVLNAWRIYAQSNC